LSLTALVHLTALAKFAVRQVWDGRRVGSRRTTRDALSDYLCQAYAVYNSRCNFTLAK
jgi:hypothetical protein